MRSNGDHLDQYRKDHPLFGKSDPGSLWGYFVVPLDGKKLHVISSGEHEEPRLASWEHVSISLPNRCPTWREMCHVKDLFWGPDELVVQFHPPKSEYVNIVQTCLHLWKSPLVIELPPLECV